jgi:hypothetical protein
MYRYSVDNAVTYTSEDFVLFRESPFACWMERLSVENPEHGIPPDVGSLSPQDSIERQDDMADTLRTDGKDVRLVEWDADEPERRSATLEAMRKGADFIVNGQLALGPLSGTANLLVRTSGYSELGDFLYVPCSTQANASQHAEFRLCFLADLLHSLQGQLPPQMLVIRGGDDLVPLETESHIYHYRAVKQRFMETMRGFRKHRMPDPAESAHFGRWSDCAHEVLKQRLLREEQVGEEITDDDYQEPVLKAAGAAAGGDSDSSLDLEARRAAEPEQDPVGEVISASQDTAALMDNGNTSGFTLAEQAHMLSPGRYTPGPGVFRLGRSRKASKPERSESEGTAQLTGDNSSQAPEATARTEPEMIEPVPEPATETTPKYNRRASDKALQNLEFIGSGPHVAGMVLDTAPAPETMPVPEADTALEPEPAPEAVQPSAISTAPAPSLRDPRSRVTNREMTQRVETPEVALAIDSVWGLPVEENTTPKAEIPAQKPIRDEPLPESARPAPVAHPTIDMDGTHMPSPPPVLTTSDAVLPADLGIDGEEVEHGFGQAASDKSAIERKLTDSFFGEPTRKPESTDEDKFSNSLITSDDYDNNN